MYFIIDKFLTQKNNTTGKVVGWVGSKALTLAPCSTSNITISMHLFLAATSRGLKISRFGSAPASSNMLAASKFLFTTAEYKAVLRRSSYNFDQSSDSVALTSYPASIKISRTSSLLRSAAKWRGLMPERLTLDRLVMGISRATMLRKNWARYKSMSGNCTVSDGLKTGINHYSKNLSWPFFAAIWIGSNPVLLALLTSAPFDRRIFTTSTWSFFEASNNAVAPSFAWVLTFPPTAQNR